MNEQKQQNNRNFVAKNMHQFNKPKVEQSKRDKHLQDAYDWEMSYHDDQDWEDERR